MTAAVFGVVGAALPLAQNAAHHTAEVEHAVLLKESEMRQAERFHEEELRFTAECYIKEHDAELRLHNIQMRTARKLAERESTRDVRAQQQYLNQAVIVTDVLMLSCCFNAISQWSPPAADVAVEWLVVAYAIGLGVSIASLTMSMWLGFKVQSRMVRFSSEDPTTVYSCGTTHPTFPSYFACHCEFLRVPAVALFLTGTLALMVAACALHGSTVTANGAAAAGVAFAVMSAVLVTGILVAELLLSDKTVDTGSQRTRGDGNEPTRGAAEMGIPSSDAHDMQRQPPTGSHHPDASHRRPDHDGVGDDDTVGADDEMDDDHLLLTVRDLNGTIRGIEEFDRELRSMEPAEV